MAELNDRGVAMSFWILAGIVLVVWLAWEFWPQKPYAFRLHEHGGLKPVLRRFLAFKVPLFDRRAQWDRMSNVRHSSVTGIIK